MFRSASRAALRNTQSSLAPARTLLQPSRRCINTNPPHLQSRSWRSSALRWGIAIAGIYYYNTSPVFAEYPESNLLNPNVEAFETGREDSTIDQLTASSRNKRVAAKSQLQTTLETASEDLAAQKSAPSDLSSAPTPEGNNGNNNEQTAISGDAQQLEEEAEGEGAFNPVTGEINWDCPCLGGMAYGPCGPQFREAFSCFVYSTEEPKGMECIDKFQAMQDCFRSHPEVYKGELEDDERAMDDVEGFEQEKGELQKEIEEGRTKAAQKQQQQTQTQTATPAKKEKKSPKSKPSQSGATATQTAPESQAESFAAGPHMSATSSSAEAGQPAKTVLKDSEYDQSKESAHGAPSKTIKTPGDRETDKNARPESEELVPKASHDARS